MTTEKETRQALKRMLANGPLTGLPVRRSDLELLLGLALSQFDARRAYTEAEVNERLSAWLETFCGPFGVDHVTVRRCLVDSQYLERDRAGTTYRIHPHRNATIEEAAGREPANVLAEISSERATRKRQHAH